MSFDQLLFAGESQTLEYKASFANAKGGVVLTGVKATQRAIEKQIAKLKREGRLIKVGPNKGGHWQVQKGK